MILKAKAYGQWKGIEIDCLFQQVKAHIPEWKNISFNFNERVTHDTK